MYIKIIRVMRVYLRKQDFCKRGLIATFEFIKMCEELRAKNIAEGKSAVLEEEDWIPASRKAKQIAATSDLLKLKRKELEALVDSVRKESLELFSKFSRSCIDNNRFC
jgi:hypothetical protein